MTDPLDDELRHRAHDARADVEGLIDAESELAVLSARSSQATNHTVATSRGHRLAIVGSVAAGAVALVGGLVLLRGTDSIETGNAPTATPVVSPIVSTSAPMTTGTTEATIGTTASAPEPSDSGPADEDAGTTVAPPVSAPAGSTEPAEPDRVHWKDLPWERTSLAHVCSTNPMEGCTQMQSDLGGALVSYDPSTRLLTRHVMPPVSADIPTEYGAVWLDAVGPDDVVYLTVDSLDPGEFAADLIAVTLDADDAGREIGRWPGVVDRVGDSELVRTAAGLVEVGCCGHEPERPAPDATVEVRWRGRDGSDTTADGPIIRTEIDAQTLTVHRDDTVPSGTRSWTFDPPGDWQPRGMPRVLPTLDGGFIANTFGAEQSIIRGWVDGTVSVVTIDTSPEFARLYLDSSGRVLLADTDRFARFEPFSDLASFWTGNREIDAGGTGAVELPGLDDDVVAGVVWAQDPIAFAHAIAGPPAVNEPRTITIERRSEFEFLVTVTTTNFFDDSVFGSRLELLLDRRDDGRFRFVSGQWSNVCQPGRGHQDLSADLCI